MINTYLSELRETLGAISGAEAKAFSDALLEIWRAGRRVYLFGNGGSASTASHFANDLSKLPGFKAQALTDVAFLTASGNDYGYEQIFYAALKQWLEPGDAVVAISASGNSPNILRAAEYARERGATVLAVTGKSGGKLAALAHVCVKIPAAKMGQQEDGHLALAHAVCFDLAQRKNP